MSDTSIPSGITFERDNFVIPNNFRRILILSDIHSPFHCKPALQKAINYGLNNKADCIILNGDIVDFNQISKYYKNPESPEFAKELEITKNILRHIRKVFKNKMIVYLEGNHEERIYKYLEKVPALQKVIKIEELLELKKLNIKYIDKKRNIHAGKMLITHGNNIKAAGLTPARNTLLKNMCNIAFGHLHRVDEYHHRTPTGEVLSSYSMGCLCDLSPDYWPWNNWVHGFGFLNITNTKGDFIFYNIKL